MKAKNQMLTNSQWRRTSGFSDKATFNKYRNKLTKEGKVVEVDKNSIMDNAEQIRLRTNTRAKIFKWVS